MTDRRDSHYCALVFTGLLLLMAGAVRAGVLEGTVVRIVDGDTVEVLTVARETRNVRLAGIDAPERGQAFGRRAKHALAALAGGKPVAVHWHKRDRWGRLVGTLVRDDRDLNLELVEQGMAWWFRKYADEQSPADRARYATAEARARQAGIGLWSDPQPMAPWDWRDREEPPEGYAAVCPCGSGTLCIGKRGGRFCVRPSGSRLYTKTAPR